MEIVVLSVPLIRPCIIQQLKVKLRKSKHNAKVVKMNVFFVTIVEGEMDYTAPT